MDELTKIIIAYCISLFLFCMVTELREKKESTTINIISGIIILISIMGFILACAVILG